MAQNKKSFVLYCDLISNIDHLTNEEKGILFTHLLEYVNDKNPVLEDRLILTAWKPIERQLKRDLIKFEEVKIKRSEAGKESARLRALKKDKTNPTKSTSVKSVQQTSTNPTVNDNVNENDNDNVNDNKKKTLEYRKTEFKNSLSQFINDFDRDLLNDFFKYWTEHGEKDRKMRFEKEKSFNIKLRLDKWLKNSIEWKKEKSSGQKEKLSAAQLLTKTIMEE